MPYEISWEDRSTMNVAYSGQTSDVEVLQVVMNQHGDERFDSLRRVLHDFTGVECCSFSEDTLLEIDTLSVGASLTNPRFKIAIVSDRQDVIDMVRLFSNVKFNAYPMQLFPTVAAAKPWLGK